MNLDPLSISLSQINYLVKNLSKRNYKNSVQEILELVSTHGQEADRYLLRCLLFEIDLNSDAIRTPNSKDFQHIQLLTQLCTVLLRKPALVSLLVYAVDKTLQNNKIKNPSNLLPTLSKILKLTPVQEVVFGLSLLHSSYQSISESALYFIKQKLPVLIRNYSNEDIKHTKVQEGGLRDSTPEVLHFILAYLLFPKEKAFLGIDSETKNLFLKGLRRDFPKALAPVILAPLLYPKTDWNIRVDKVNYKPIAMASNMNNELHTIIREMGHTFCATIDDGRAQMNTLGMRDLSPSVVARILIMMVKSVAEDTPQSCATFWNNPEQPPDKSSRDNSSSSNWNVEVFVQLLKEFNPNLSWIDVIGELDNGDLFVKDRKSLLLLFTALRLGLQHQGFSPEQFPMDMFYRHWKHSESQLSVIMQMLKNSDIISFADYPFHAICEDGLKVSPDTSNKEIAVWRSIDLVELLMYIADRGLAAQIHEILKFPLQQCPDVLALAMIQITQPMTLFRQELLSNLLPLFLAGHPNASAVLNNLWLSQNLTMKQIVMHGMAEWYLRGEGDPIRLSRILDIAHELKALTPLLNVQTYPFTIDLACLASRREYLKLDKWLNDKIREYGDAFIGSLLKFIQRRCPYLFMVNFKEDLFVKPPFPQETLLTILSTLQSCLGNVPSDTNDAILNVLSNCNAYLNKSRQAVVTSSNLLRSQRGIDPSFNANLFSPGTPVDSLVNLSGSLANLNISNPQTSNAFNMSGNLGQLATSSSASPSRLVTPSQNANFALLPPLSGTMNTQLNHMTPSAMSNGMSGINSLPQMMPQQPNALEKYRMSEAAGGFVMPAEFNNPVSKDVEDEANAYFQRIFSYPPHTSLTSEEVLETLKKFHQSPHKRERDVFHCIIRSLFDEYKFFHQYPDKELFIIAQLFGGILAQGLIPHTSTLYAHGLKLIIEALRKPVGTKIYTFGISALDQLKPVLKDLPKFCEVLIKLPFYHDLPASLVEYIEHGARGQEPSHKTSASNVTPLLSSPLFKNSMSANSTPTTSPAAKLGPASTRPSIATATNIDTLLVAMEKEEKIVMPPDSFQEKVAFVFNNLSQLNIQAKSDEIKEIVREEHYSWLAQYMVMKRASIEFNFHVLYSNFVDTVKLPSFSKLVLLETYRNIKVLLRSDKSTANYSDRTLLKNLGHWLGVITLAKNKPVLMDDLDVRMLLVEAQRKGSQEMLYVIPFVAKMMDSCVKSKAFKPPCPWTMSVICLLAEIHQEPGLKLNLKFEVEVLLKSLQLDMKNLHSTTYLKEGDLVKYMKYELTNKPKSPSPSPVVSTPTPSQPLTPSSQNTSSSSVILSSGSSSASVTPSLITNTSNEELMLQMAQIPMNASTPNTLVAPVSFTPEPKYNLTTFNITTAPAVASLLVINSQLPLFQAYPSLKQCIRMVFERCIQEWLPTLVDRSVKTAVNTTEILIKNDFALDPDESRMRAAAQYMVRNLTAAMALTICRDTLMNSIMLNLKSSLMNLILKGDIQPFASMQQKDWIDQGVNTCVNDNTEMVCAFVQKNAIEKSVIEIDRHLMSEYEKRKNARSEGRRYCDSGVLTYQAERMPEQVRLKVGGVSPQQMAVYEDFARNIPGFQTLSDREAATMFSINKQALTFGTNEEMHLFFDKLVTEIEVCLQAINMQGLFAGNGSQSSNIQSLLECLLTVKRNGSRDVVTGIAIIQKIMESLSEYIDQVSNDSENVVRYRDTYTRLLKTCQESRSYGIVWTNKTVASLTSLMEKLKMSSTSNNSTCANNSSISTSGEYASNAPSTPYIHSGILQTRDGDDPPGLADKIELLLREWMSAYQSVPLTKDHTKPFGTLVHQLNVSGLLKTDDLMTRFFRQSVHIVINIYYRALLTNELTITARIKVFHTLDGYARLMSMLVKHSGDHSNTSTKLNLLNKILGIIAGVTLQDCDQRGIDFYQLPYHRIFSMLFMELTYADHVLETINFPILQAFAHTYHILRPSKAPAFAYAWLELISHRLFVSRVLAMTPQQKGWSMYAQLMIDLFKFLAPFLRNAELAKPVSTLYKGTLRVLLVLLHDFPEFLCDYHYGFCDVIPPNCIQLRNLILSAFPRSMRLPDPFTPNLKVDLLPEIILPPRILPNYVSLISPITFKKDLDSYLKLRTPSTFLGELRALLQTDTEPDSRYNMQLVNAIVLYVGAQAIADIRARNLSPNMTTIADSAHMDIFQHLAVDLDPEGRYVFFNAIVNQLRYPNSHTHYFSCTLLYMFAEANAEVIQEQITRILLERIIVNRPHPWGLLITFIELIKNPTYKFWDHDFVHCAPEIEKLFESVANSCMGRKPVAVVPVENEVSEG